MPVIPVSSSEAHVFAPRLQSNYENADRVQDLDGKPLLQFPYLALLNSYSELGLVLVRGVGTHRYLGITLDDTMGECIDSVMSLMVKLHGAKLANPNEHEYFIEKQGRNSNRNAVQSVVENYGTLDAL